MTRTGIGSRRILLTPLFGCLLAAPVYAAPGDMLGGDDSGCAPSTKQGISCAKKVAAGLTKLRRAVLGCHLTQVGQAFKTGHSSPGFSNAEENCEEGPSQQSAKARFDALIDKLAPACDTTVIAHAIARRDTLLSDQTIAGSMDKLNGTFFCDATSGDLIDPDDDGGGPHGDDGGYIPATPANYKCGVAVAKSWSKLDVSVAKCHDKLAATVFKSGVFDEEACEETGPKSARAKYDVFVSKLIADGLCPPCLASSATGALALGASTVADADADLHEIYICPGP